MDNKSIPLKWKQPQGLSCGFLIPIFRVHKPKIEEDTTINNFGWNENWNAQFDTHAAQELIPARVTAVFSQHYEVVTDSGKGIAELTGKLRHGALYAANRPAVGDWVAVRPVETGKYILHNILPRASYLQRQGVDGDLEAQVVAANVDACFIVQSLHGDFSIPRLDRYIAFAANTNVTPVIILTKADLVSESEQLAEKVRLTYPELTVFVASSLLGVGVDSINEYMQSGRTYVAVGSSGVGKSTLVNALAGTELMKTAQVREDDQKGRHTTTHRQMFRLANGALFIDTPGIRELALFEYKGLSGSFRDIEALAQNCKFRDCLHVNEPGCAVQRAIENGQLDQKRIDNFEKMKREERTYKSRQILLNKKVSKAKIKRSNTHYKDFVRGGEKSWKGGENY